MYQEARWLWPPGAPVKRSRDVNFSSPSSGQWDLVPLELIQKFRFLFDLYAILNFQRKLKCSLDRLNLPGYAMFPLPFFLSPSARARPDWPTADPASQRLRGSLCRSLNPYSMYAMIPLPLQLGYPTNGENEKKKKIKTRLLFFFFF